MSYKDGILSESEWARVRTAAESLADKYIDQPFADGFENDLKKLLRTKSVSGGVTAQALKWLGETR